MSAPLTLRQIQIRSTLVTVPFLVPILYGVINFFFLDAENNSINFFLRASIGPIVGLFICWALCPQSSSSEFQTPGIGLKSCWVLSSTLILGVLIGLPPDQLIPSWVKSEVKLFVASLLLTYTIFFIAFSHWAQKVTNATQQSAN